jgi:regulator of sigma E protease
VDVAPRDTEGEGFKVGAYFRASAPTTEIVALSVSSPWYAAGLAKGDRILDVQGKRVATGIALLVALDEAISSSAAEVSMTAERKGELITVRWLTAGRSAEDLLDGVQLGDLGVDMRRPPLADGLALGMRQFASYAGLLAETVRGLTSGAIAPSEALQGPVGIASLVRQGWSYGLLVFLQLWALLSLNFGFINLIPFPALDGSRVAFALVEWVRGRPIPPQKEGLVHAIGFAILLALLVLITFQDVARLLG